MRRFYLVIVLAGVACGDNSEPTTPADVSGNWSATVSNMSGSGITCNSTSPTQLLLHQEENQFSGGYSGGELACAGPGGTSSLPIEPGLVVDGQVNGNSISFDLDTPDFHHTGTVNGNSLSGTARWRIDFGPPAGLVTLDGSWTAAMQ